MDVIEINDDRTDGNSDDDDCIIIEERCMEVKPNLMKRVKLEIPETSTLFSVKEVKADGHCLIRCFAEYFKENIDMVISRLRDEFKRNIDVYEAFSSFSSHELLSELNQYLEYKKYNTNTVDQVMEALAKIYKHRIFIFDGDISGEPTGYVGEQYKNNLYLQRSSDHYDLVIKNEPCFNDNRDDFFTYDKPSAEMLLYAILVDPKRFEENTPL